MYISKNTVSIILLSLVFIGVILVGIATDVIRFGVDTAVDFAAEQQPGAKSAGDYIGKQYSRLRELSVGLDALACKVQVNEAAQSTLKETYVSEPDPLNWPADARAELQALRWEHTTLLQAYAQTASEYNDLRTDIRTVVDNLGLQIQDIPQAEALSPVPGMCSGFALPELE